MVMIAEITVPSVVSETIGLVEMSEMIGLDHTRKYAPSLPRRSQLRNLQHVATDPPWHQPEDRTDDA